MLPLISASTLFGSFRNLNSNFLSEDYFENFDIYILMSDKWLLIVQNSEEENRIIRLDTIRNEHQPRNELESFVLNYHRRSNFTVKEIKLDRCNVIASWFRSSSVNHTSRVLEFVSRSYAWSADRRGGRIRAENVGVVGRPSVAQTWHARADHRPEWSLFSQPLRARARFHETSSLLDLRQSRMRIERSERRCWIGEMELYYVWRIRTENLRWKFLFLFIFSLQDRKISPTVSLVRYISDTPTACSNS